jgi:hypothetical protein
MVEVPSVAGITAAAATALMVARMARTYIRCEMMKTLR